VSKATASVSAGCVFDGLPEEIRNVRAFVEEFVVGCPMADEVVLLSSELSTNAVRHTASGDDGHFFVLVLPESGRVRVEVHDLGSDTEPVIRKSHQPAGSGEGLFLVEHIASRWGFHGGKHGRIVWFEMDWQ
jgi:anti-sigma regulatory factor (Ser/Thr protein kinase)